ncbi:hypothetical protein [Imhoffiella purpurea]|nr:hypothetical protein [Imhoffiella purpurea]
MHFDRPDVVSSSHTGRLILTASDPHVSPHVPLLIEALAEVGFIGERLSDAGGDAFRTGPMFLSLVAFTGCAVQIRSNPDGRGAFCHVRVSSSFRHPHLLHGRNTRAPRCRECRHRLVDWRERLGHWATHPHAGVTCPNCRETRPPWLWDWKQQGGFGRFFVQVEEIFPGEATPTHTLIDVLTRASGTGWRHFYVQE